MILYVYQLSLIRMSKHTLSKTMSVTLLLLICIYTCIICSKLHIHQLKTVKKTREYEKKELTLLLRYQISSVTVVSIETCTETGIGKLI